MHVAPRIVLHCFSFLSPCLPLIEHCCPFLHIIDHFCPFFDPLLPRCCPLLPFFAQCCPQVCTPHPAEKQASPPCKKLALTRPAPQNWRNLQGAAGKNWLQIPLIPLSIMPANDALKEERVGKYFHFSLFTYFDCGILLWDQQPVSGQCI